MLVRRADRPDEDPLAAECLGPGLPLTRVGADDHARVRSLGLLRHDPDPSIERDDTVLVRQQRVDVELPDGGTIDDELRQPKEARHEGIEKYTIGQRKGLNYAAGARRYVLDIIPSTNDVILGEREELLAPGLIASRVNWLIDPPQEPLSYQAKIRYRHAGAPAVVSDFPPHAYPSPPGGEGIGVRGGHVRVDFTEPQSAVTPGQAVVFYDGDRVLGGGWIEQAIKASPLTPTPLPRGERG